MKATPPPPPPPPNELPDYYMGFPIFYDEFSGGKCKSGGYDGSARVRCPTRKDAMNYISERKVENTAPAITSRIIDARISLNRAISQLDAAACVVGGLEKLQLERLAVKLKPVLVEIDNIVIK